jgi:hypothetical protein
MMPLTIKYNGSERGWDELSVTGKPSVWNPGQQEERSDSEAALLIGTGLFSRVYTDSLTTLSSEVKGLNAASAKRPLFRDTFKRADTLAGTIGAGWTAKGVYVSSYPLPAATDGKITSQAVETPSGLTTYWMRTLPQTPVQIQSVMAWDDLANGQAGYQTFALICTASANLIDNMGIHITLAHTTLRIQERIAGGAFVDLIAAVDIQPRLSMAQGENVLTVTIDAANNSGVVYLNERAYPFSSPNLAANIGAVVAFEIFQTGGASTRYKCRVLEFSAG